MDEKNRPYSRDIQLLLSQFEQDFSTASITPLGNGHINDTFKLTTTTNHFVIQRVNHTVFPDPVAVCNNTQHINQHLNKQKLIGNYPYCVPQQLQTKRGESAVKIGDNYWRIMEFIENSYTLESVTSAKQAALVAQAFAQFSHALSEFPARNLSVIIDDFHNISSRMEQLQQATSKDEHNRLMHCQVVVDFCFSQQSFIDHVMTLCQKLPIHVTHNDTKINNLLFSSSSHQPCAVIDLDTCMPGLLMHDFGDMVRTCCSNLAEDDTDIHNMVLNFSIFEALIVNYQETFADNITALEKQSLIVGARLLPFIIGTRFLTDYLNGDSYFQTAHTNHNLDRAKNQFQLYKLITEAEDNLQQFIQ